MAAWVLSRSSRRSEGLLRPCKGFFQQQYLLEGLSTSAAHQRTAPPGDSSEIGLQSDGEVSVSKSDAAKGSLLAEAWLAPHLLEKVLDLAKCGGHSHSRVVRPHITSATSFCCPQSGSIRCYGTLIDGGAERLEPSLPAPMIRRLEGNGVELTGSLPVESTPIKIKPKQIFAVVQVGAHQFKVTPDDVLYVEKLNGPDIKSTVLLKKVLLLGSKTKTIVGRPFIPDATVSATVEAQVKDAKVLILKKRRRKNSRRLKGHRQELTRLRILDITGIEEDQEEGKPERVHNQAGVVARLKTPEPGKVSAYAFQPRPLPQSRDIKKQRRSPAVPGYGRRLQRRLTFGAERRRSQSVSE